MTSYQIGIDLGGTKIEGIVLANDGSIAFLADEGENVLEAWLNTGMAAPHTMAKVLKTYCCVRGLRPALIRLVRMCSTCRIRTVTAGMAPRSISI